MADIIHLQEIKDSTEARYLEPYYLDLCNQKRELIAEVFRKGAGRKPIGLEDSEWERYNIRLNVLDLKIQEVAAMMMKLKKQTFGGGLMFWFGVTVMTLGIALGWVLSRVMMLYYKKTW